MKPFQRDSRLKARAGVKTEAVVVEGGFFCCVAYDQLHSFFKKINNPGTNKSVSTEEIAG